MKLSKIIIFALFLIISLSYGKKKFNPKVVTKKIKPIKKYKSPPPWNLDLDMNK